MHRRFLDTATSLALALLIVCATTTSSLADSSDTPHQSQFTHPKLGSCYSDPRAAVKDLFPGYDVENDENIQHWTKNSWLWVVDRTASKNPAWFLLYQAKGKYCLQAHIPAASALRFTSPRTLLAHISPEQGLPGKLIELERPSGREAFVATRCYLATMGGKRKRADCSTVFD